MRFTDALTQLLDGQPMARACWTDGGQIHITGPMFHYTNNSGDKEPYEVTTDDIFAADWGPVNLEMTETPLAPSWASTGIDPFA